MPDPSRHKEGYPKMTIVVVGNKEKRNFFFFLSFFIPLGVSNWDCKWHRSFGNRECRRHCSLSGVVGGHIRLCFWMEKYIKSMPAFVCWHFLLSLLLYVMLLYPNSEHQANTTAPNSIVIVHLGTSVPFNTALVFSFFSLLSRPWSFIKLHWSDSFLR